MSLINDALKKAQQQREKTPGTPDTPASSPGAAAVPPAAPAARSSGRTFTLLVVAGCALIAVSVATTVFLLRSPAEKPAPVVASAPTPAGSSARPAAPPLATPTPAPASVHPAEPAAAGPVPATASPATVAPANSSAANPAAAPVGAGPSPAKRPEAAASAPPAPAATPPAETAARAAPAAAPAPAVEAPAVKLTYRIQGMIDKFRISGIRLSGTDSKVILNEHLFRQDDLIEPSLGLRLTRIESHALTFTDAEGNTYVKRF